MIAQTLRNKEKVGPRELQIAAVDKAAGFGVPELVFGRHAVLVHNDLLDQSVLPCLVCALCNQDVCETINLLLVMLGVR